MRVETSVFSALAGKPRGKTRESGELGSFINDIVDLLTSIYENSQVSNPDGYSSYMEIVWGNPALSLRQETMDSGRLSKLTSSDIP